MCANLRGMMKGFIFKSQFLKMPAANCGRFSFEVESYFQYRERTGVPKRAARLGWRLRPDRAICFERESIVAYQTRLGTQSSRLLSLSTDACTSSRDDCVPRKLLREELSKGVNSRKP